MARACAFGKGESVERVKRKPPFFFVKMVRMNKIVTQMGDKDDIVRVRDNDIVGLLPAGEGK